MNRTPPPAIAEFIHRGTMYKATSKQAIGVYVVVFESDGEQVARYVYPATGLPQQALVMALERFEDVSE